MCGIFGIDGCDDAANLTYLGLYAQQHRGQESAGMVSWDGAQLHLERGMGHVSEIFKEKVIARLPGRRALGHTRYSTAGSSVVAATDPRRFENPLSMRDALRLARQFWDAEEVIRLYPAPEVLPRTLELLENLRLERRRLLDAALAATLDCAGIRRLATFNPDDFTVFGFLDLVSSADGSPS